MNISITMKIITLFDDLSIPIIILFCCLFVVIETIVKTTESFSTGATRGRFLRVHSGNLCTLCDTSHKDVVQRSGELTLQAITLKGGHSERKGTTIRCHTEPRSVKTAAST